MSKELASDDKLQVKRLKSEANEQATEKQPTAGPDQGAASVLHLQQTVGNQAVQRLLAQRSGDGSFELDEQTAGRINQARGGGQALDNNLQRQMGATMGHDLSQVRVHTSSEADTLSSQLNAKAFTTGQDIFFKQGEYNPGSSSGQELIAHEVTHVVQQSTGQVGSGGGGMTVNPPGDVYEQEADTVAKQVVHGAETGQTAGPSEVQRSEAPEAEEEELQMKAIQRSEAPEAEEEELQMKAIQRSEAPEAEEEELQMKAIQRSEAPEAEEEELQMKAIQRSEAPEAEEEELQMKPEASLQRQEDETLAES